MQGNHMQTQNQPEDTKKAWEQPRLMTLDLKETEGGIVTSPFEATFYTTFTTPVS